jgi:hypothetical protein
MAGGSEPQGGAAAASPAPSVKLCFKELECTPPHFTIPPLYESPHKQACMTQAIRARRAGELQARALAQEQGEEYTADKKVTLKKKGHGKLAAAVLAERKAKLTEEAQVLDARLDGLQESRDRLKWLLTKLQD